MGWRRAGLSGAGALRFCKAALLLVVLFVGAALAFGQQTVISKIDIRGNRRIPAETIRARLFTREGDVYDPSAIERDFNSLWNTGYFDDLRFEREETTKGWIIHIYVREKPTIREIHYEGLNAVSQSDLLDRFKERKVGLSQESQYDPTKVKKAEVVIKELLAEHGHQFATVHTEIHPIPPAAVGITFNIKEGPKVKVGNIRFEGNHAVRSNYLRSSMKNLRPIGVPHSIFLENIFSRTYDATKLSEDAERVRMAYQQKGYFKALVEDPKTQMRDYKPGLIHVPMFQKPGKRVDITLPVSEGDRYHLAAITFTGNKAITNTKALRSVFTMKDGDIFDTELVRKGLDDLRKAYGQLGYINFTPVPDTKIGEDKKLITLNIDLDEGKPFYVRRIEFVGNTTTRDKVIRRELALEEGQVYNSRLWEMSLLRLNQLGYFEQLKPEEATDKKLNEQDGTVDLTLKVKEKGKNSIGLTGGVSGLSGAFVGINYETNNFLGQGETLSVSANVGNVQRNITFGFTEPYAFDRPLQLGFTVYYSKYNYNQAKQEQLLLNEKLNLPQAVLNELLNYTQSSTGFTTSASYPLHSHTSFKRVGLAYNLDTTSLQSFSTATTNYFELLNFRSVSGPSALNGIITSKVTPSFVSNTISSPVHPHAGQSFSVSTDVAGLGGNVKMIRPVVEFKRFVPMKIFKPLSTKNQSAGKQTLGFRVQSSFVTGYGGVGSPPFQRFYLGGDNDIRGFDVRSITPYGFITTNTNTAGNTPVPLVNPDDPCIAAASFPTGCRGVPVDPTNYRRGIVEIPLAVQQLSSVGGDSSLIANLEYRIPLAGPVTLAIFDDFGFDGILRTSQLQINPTDVASLSGNFGCPVYTTGGCVPADQEQLSFPKKLGIVPGTNWQPRMSTGLELQVLMPVINAPFRIYWAYNPMRLDKLVNTAFPISRSLFPAGAAGDFTYNQVNSLYAPTYVLQEPLKTFRFTVSTTF